MISGFRRELTFLLIATLLLLFFGVLYDATLELFCAGLAFYALWNVINLRRMAHWLDKPGKNVPESVGIWDEIYYRLFQLYKRQRKARKKLAAIVSRFQSSTQALPYAAVVLNSNFEIDWFNQAAATIFGFKQGRDTGTRIDNLLRDPAFIEYLNGQHYEEQLEIQVGPRRIALCINAYGQGEYLLSARDITQQKQLEEMRRDFIANASHELRTPITVISGYLENLVENADESAAVPLQKMQMQTERMKQILEDLIVLARLESKELPMYPDVVDIAGLLTEVHQDACMLDEGKHEITLSVEEASVQGSRGELQMAFSNLVTNAIRYTPEGGNIRLFCRRNRESVLVGVEDNGIGIKPEQIPRLTERFYRADPGRARDSGGTGLGLAIVKHVLDRHNARLHIESRPGAGSLFRCDFS